MKQGSSAGAGAAGEEPYAPPAQQAWPSIPPQVTSYETARRRALWLTLLYLTLPLLLFAAGLVIGFVSSDPWEGIDRMVWALGLSLGALCLLAPAVTGYATRLYLLLGRRWTAVVVALLGASSVGLLAFPFVLVSPRSPASFEDRRGA